MQLSVIIVNYNVSHFLHQSLMSVEQAMKKMEGEIIVVDNNSTDGSCESVKQFFPKVKLISNEENFGFAKANNQGVKIAKGKYILILNPDTLVAEDTFQKLFVFAENHPNIGIFGVPMYDGKGFYLKESKRNIPKPISSFRKLLGLNSTYYATHLKERESGNIDILTGAFMWIEKLKYMKVGGFDEDYFMYGEDIDLSYKILKKGYSNYYFSHTPIIHFKGESTSKDAAYLNHFYGAMRIFYKKHFKISLIDDLILHLGISFWKWVGSIKLKTKGTQSDFLPSKILYIGNENVLYSQLQKIYQTQDVKIFSQCETRVMSRFDDLEKIKKMISEYAIQEIIFDQQNLTFAKIIFFMIHLSKENLTFKIHPNLTNFLIGSNSNKTKGKIIEWI